jgi:hypothetical protein
MLFHLLALCYKDEKVIEMILLICSLNIFFTDIQLEAQQHKVCVQTEKTVYPDSFFEGQDLVVNALDNVEARRYVDM